MERLQLKKKQRRNQINQKKNQNQTLQKRIIQLPQSPKNKNSKFQKQLMLIGLLITIIMIQINIINKMLPNFNPQTHHNLKNKHRLILNKVKVLSIILFFILLTLMLILILILFLHRLHLPFHLLLFHLIFLKVK